MFAVVASSLFCAFSLSLLFRMKPCRPLAFWPEKNKQQHIDNEDFDYTVWRAANAILDVRILDMRLAIKARLDAGEELKEMNYVGPGCYIETE